MARDKKNCFRGEILVKMMGFFFIFLSYEEEKWRRGRVGRSGRGMHDMDIRWRKEGKFHL